MMIEPKVSARAALQERIVEWLSARSQTFHAPYGILPGLHKKGKATVRTVTFGISRTLDAELTIWSAKRLELHTSRGDERFASEAEFYAYAVARYGAPASVE